MNARLFVGLLSVHLAFAPSVFAGATFLGIGVGEEHITLAGILSQAIQQVQFLSQLAALTRSMKEDIALVKDVYGTVDDVVNARWDKLTQEFLLNIINSDPSLREIYANSAAIIQDRVPRGNQFRKLVDTGAATFLVVAFGPYPFGKRGDVHALTDQRAMGISGLVNKQRQDMQAERKLITDAWRECQNGGLDACARAQTTMQMQTTELLHQLRQTEEERGLLEAHRAQVESGEKRQKETALQEDFSQIADSFRTLRGKTSRPTIGEMR